MVGDTVEVSTAKLNRSHKAKHDRTREHGALANPAAGLATVPRRVRGVEGSGR